MNNTHEKYELQWVRELFIAFYLPFFIVTILYKLYPGSHILYLMLCAITIIYAPGILLAFGYYIGYLQKHTSGNAKHTLLKCALFFFLFFVIIGELKEKFLEQAELFSAFKDIIALIRIPGITSIFLTLAILSLIFAFYSDPIIALWNKPYMVILISIIGLAFSLIPEGLIGYGAFGVFIGGDCFGCIPIATNLIPLFWGMYLYKKEGGKKPIKLTILFLAICFLFGGLGLLLHQKVLAYALLGAGLSYLCAMAGKLLLPVYNLLETFVVNGYQGVRRLLQKWNVLSQKRPGFSILSYYILYSFFFLILLYILFIPYLESGMTLIWRPDGLGQYIPKVYRFISYMPSVISDLLHGNLDFQQYDFNTGLGATITFAFDPVFWLYLLFPKSQVEFAYSFLILLRFFLLGISSSAMFLYFKKSKYVTFICSLAYTFCGYAIFGGTRHGQFLTPLILLPLLVISMEQLITKKRWYLMTILVAISLLCSYYFLYMNTIALGIYYVTRILCTKEYRNVKTFFTRGLIIVGSYILGTCIGSLSLCISFGSFLGSSRTSSGGVSSFITTTPLFYRAGWLADSLIAFISADYSPGLWLKFGFAPLALFALVLLFTRKNKKELKPMFFIFTIFLIFPIFGYVFSGFSSVNNRWCYIYALLICYILADNLERFWNLTLRELEIMTAITFLFGVIIYFSTKHRNECVMGMYGILVITLLLLVFMNHPKIQMKQSYKKGIVLGITLIAIVFNVNFFIRSGSMTGTHLETYTEQGKAYSTVTSTALKYLDKIEDKGDDFYRSTNLFTRSNTRSSSMVLGYNDFATFSSTLNGGIVDYNSMMGNCRWNIVSIYDYNARTMMNELASVKYLGGKITDVTNLPFGYKLVQDELGKKKNCFIYENEYALPLGYTYSNVVTESDAATYSAAQRQELTMMSAIVKDSSPILESNTKLNRTTVDQLPLTVHNIDIQKMEFSGCHMEDDILMVDEIGATLKLKFESEPNSETYISIVGDIDHEPNAKEQFLNVDVNAKGTVFEQRFRVDSYSTKQEEYLLNLGYHADSIKDATLTFKDLGCLAIDDLKLYSQSMDCYPSYANALKENSLEHAKAEKNTITGQITLDQDKLLVITIPYQKGWTAYVDDEVVPLQRVNYQYVGLELEKGTHSIQLHYALPGLRYALIATFGGLVVFVLIILCNLIRKRSKHNHKAA